MTLVSALHEEGMRHRIAVGGHQVFADEPESNGGADTAPTPIALLAGALASCTAITMRMYAARKEIDMGDAVVEVDYETDERSELLSISVVLRLPESLGPDTLARLQRIAGKCPVRRALTREPSLEISERLEVY